MAFVGSTISSPEFECGVTSKGQIRARMPLTYPDGGMVDIFVLKCEAHYSITGFGELLAGFECSQ